MKIKTAHVEVPAGTYFLGDPCYAVPDDEWFPVLDSSGYFGSKDGGSPIGTMTDGTQVLGFGTAYGDGEYRDQYGNFYGVDAGLIGLVPIEVVDRDPRYPRARYDGDLGKVVTFDHPVICHSHDGVLTFGTFVIDTDPDEEDYYEDPDEEDDES